MCSLYLCILLCNRAPRKNSVTVWLTLCKINTFNKKKYPIPTPHPHLLTHPRFQIFPSICATPNFKSWIRPWTWYLCHHHNHIQVNMVVGDGLTHICNNRGYVARSVYIRNIQCNDNNQWCLRLFHAAASVTSSAVLCMRKGTWAVKRTTCVPPSGDPDITQSLNHVRRLLRQGNTEEMHRLVTLNVFRPKYLLLNFTCTLG